MILPNKLDPNEFGSEASNQVRQFRLGWNAAIDAVQTLEDLKADLCRNYCKYTDIWDADSEGCELAESDICANCPLGRL